MFSNSVSSYFADVTVSDRLLELGRERGWLSAGAVAKVRMLIRHGLHPEQALIGTGLLSPDQYGALLSRQFSLPFMRLTQDDQADEPSLLSSDLVSTYCFHIFDQTGRVLTVGSAEPSPAAWRALEAELAPQKFSFSPVVMLRSEWRHVHGVHPSVPSSSITLWRAFQKFAEEQAVHQLRLTPHGASVTVNHEARGQALHPATDPPQLRSEEMSALVLHASREAGQSGWHVQVHTTSHGPALNLTRRQPFSQVTHPADWMDALGEKSRAIKGLLLVIDADPYVRQRLAERFPRVEAASTKRVSVSQPSLYDGRNEDEQELAWQAALQGQPVIALASTTGHDWWTPAAEAGVPIHVIRARRQAEGVAWESCALAYAS